MTTTPKESALIKGRRTLFEGEVLDDESPTSANLGNDHGFINKNTLSIGMKPFGEPQSKAMRAYAQSGQYHTIVESRVRLTPTTI